MRKQLVLFLFCLIGFFATNIRSQVTTVEINNFQAKLPELQANPWDLDYQIKMQNLQNPQFADVIRKRFLRNPTSPKKAFDETQEQKTSIGKARIKAGKATTTFKYNPKLTLKEYLLLQSDSNELRQIVEQNADVCLKMFRQSLKTHKLTQNDIVDAGALAFILSYEIYFGEKPSKSHLNWMRKKGRSILLKLANFQGTDDAERQRTFEIYGVLTMYAKLLQQNSLKGNILAAKEAKETSGEVLKEVWGSSTDSIQILPVGFIHKGQKIILDKQATQFFNFKQDLQTAKKLSGGNIQIETQYQSFLNQVYKEMFLKKMTNNDLATCGVYSFSKIYPYFSNAGELNNNQLEGVYDVFKKAVLTSADIQAASDENKQIACEIFAIRAALLKKTISENTDSNITKLLSEQFINQLFQAYDQQFSNFQMKSNTFLRIGELNLVK